MKHIKKLIALTLVVMSVVVFAVPAMASSTKYVTCTSGSTVKLRKTASTSAIVLVNVPKYSAVTYYSSSDGWSYIKYSSTSGYMMSEFLTSTPPWITRYGSSNLYYGCYSSYVYAMQTTLYCLGYINDSFDDNNFDYVTLGGVEAFQEDQGLTVDGIVGPNTKKALYYAWVNN
jgi:mannosyl-glycoprotein endo-beta-N-acetylglucosaminidase